MEKPRALDHLVLPTASLGEAAARLSALGFTVAPRGVHPFGTVNRCVYFSDGTFIEPLAIGDADLARDAAGDGNVFVARDRDFRERNGEEGFSALVFGSADADADHAEFTAAGVSAGARLDFSRPFVDAAGKSDTASFRLAFAADPASIDAFLFSCERVNAPKVDRSALQAHANGVRRIVAIVAVSSDPAAAAAFFARAARSRVNADALVGVPLANAMLSVLGAEQAEALTGSPLPAAPGLRLRAVVFGVSDLATTEHLLRDNAVVYHKAAGRLVVPAAPGQGAAFVFEENQ